MRLETGAAATVLAVALAAAPMVSDVPTVRAGHVLDILDLQRQ